MLILFQSLRGRTVRARDGEEGVVDDVLFDERNWSLLHVVVKVGSWLTHRKVLLAPDRIVGLDRESGQMNVALDTREVRAAPGMETCPPRSRQRTIAYLDAYRRWLPWGRTPGVSPLATQAIGRRGFDESRREVHHYTRSAREVVGYGLEASDGPAGRVTDLVVDDENWRVPYLAASVRFPLPGTERLIESDAVRDIDLAERLVRVAHSVDQIERAPALEASGGAIRLPGRPGPSAPRQHA